MALEMELRIINSTTLFNLTSGTGCIITDNGFSSTRAGDDEEWVWDEVRLTLRGNPVKIQESMSAIGRALDLARDFYNGGLFSEVQLYGRTDASAEVGISTVIDGYLSRPTYDTISSGAVSVVLSVKRRNCWYYTPRDITGYQGENSPNVYISDCNDGANVSGRIRRNYVDYNISKTDIPGDMPALTRLVIIPNVGATAINIGRMYIYQGVSLNTAWSPNQEYQGSGSQTAGTNIYAGSNYINHTITGTTSFINVAVADRFPGINRARRDYALMAHLPTIPSVPLVMTLSHSSALWIGPTKTAVIPNKLTQLGVIQPSPADGLIGTVTMAVRTADGSTQTLGADFYQVLPLDGYAVVNAEDNTSFSFYFGASQNPALAWGDTESATVEGAGIMLRPGMVNRLYFLWDRADHTFSANDYIRINVATITPRRRLL